MSASGRQELDGKALKDAIEVGYIVANTPDSLAPLSWMGRCQEEKRACVVLYRDGDRGAVHLDMTPSHRTLSDVGFKLVEELLVAHGTDGLLNRTGLQGDRMAFDRAKALAKELQAVANNPDFTAPA